MGKQTFDRTKKILGISLIILFVMSIGIAVVSAAPPPGGYGGGGGHGKNCHWVCDNWHQQRYCDHGHWVYDHGQRHWRCDHWSWRWVCGHRSWKCY